MKENEALSLKRIHLDTLNPARSIKILNSRIEAEVRKNQQSVCFIIGLTTMIFAEIITGSAFLSIIGFALAAYLSSLLKSSTKTLIYGYFPNFLKIDKEMNDLKQSKERIISKAESLKNELESRSEGYISGFSNLIHSREFQCPEVTDDKLWHYLSLSFQQRGMEIPLDDYQRIISSLIQLVEHPEVDTEKQFLIERSKILSEISDSSAWGTMVDSAKIMIREIGISYSIKPHQTVLFTKFDEAMAEIEKHGGWYDQSDWNRITPIKAYKNGLTTKSPDIEKLLEAAQQQLVTL